MAVIMRLPLEGAYLTARDLHDLRAVCKKYQDVAIVSDITIGTHERMRVVELTVLPGESMSLHGGTSAQRRAMEFQSAVAKFISRKKSRKSSAS